MNTRFAVVLVSCAAIASVATLMATEKPTADFQAVMRSNGSIVDVSQGTDRASTGSNPRSETAGLRTHIRAKDYDAIAADAATLKANFTKIQAFWTGRKVDDAVGWSKAGVQAASDLEAAAKAKDDAKISASATAVAATCRDCHQAHRAMQLIDRTFEIM